MSYRIGLKNGNYLIPKCHWQIPDSLTGVISLTKACATYHYSRNALLRKIQRCEIQGFKIGRRWFLVPITLKKRLKVVRA